MAGELTKSVNLVAFSVNNDFKSSKREKKMVEEDIVTPFR